MSDYTPYIYLIKEKQQKWKQKKTKKKNHENDQVSAIFGIFSSFVLFSPNIFNQNINFYLKKIS